FFSSRRRHTRSYGDWSSDVCSSDLLVPHARSIAQKSKQQVLSTDVLVMQAEGFLLSEDHRFLGAFRETFEHGHYLPGRNRRLARSEERRVGKECRGGWWADEGRERG